MTDATYKPQEATQGATDDRRIAAALVLDPRTVLSAPIDSSGATGHIRGSGATCAGVDVDTMLGAGVVDVDRIERTAADTGEDESVKEVQDAPQYHPLNPQGGRSRCVNYFPRQVTDFWSQDG